MLSLMLCAWEKIRNHSGQGSVVGCTKVPVNEGARHATMLLSTGEQALAGPSISSDITSGSSAVEGCVRRSTVSWVLVDTRTPEAASASRKHHWWLALVGLQWQIHAK